MSNEDPWIRQRISEAQQRHPLVTEAVSARMIDLLNGQLIEGQLTSTELLRVADGLLADMVPALPEAETKQ